jgi:mono/diheme cytochrome c family protein
MLRTLSVLALAIWIAGLIALVSARPMDVVPRQSWRIPPTAAEEKSPLPVNEALLAAGRKVFVARCQRCHGPEGKGDGPDASDDHRENMDLTDPKRAADNPAGVVFYKVWYGRQEPRMPAFEDQLTKEQAWAVVGYTLTLRRK